MSRPYNKTLFCISGLRVVLGAIFIIVFNRYSETSAWVALTLLIIAQLSDHLDGYIARIYSKPTLSGYMQDSIADKLFQIAALLAIVREYELPIIIVWLIVFRDLIILATRVVETDNISAMKQNKIYSIFFAVFLSLGIITLVLAVILNQYQNNLITLGNWLIYLSLVPAAFGQYKLLKNAQKLKPDKHGN